MSDEPLRFKGNEGLGTYVSSSNPLPVTSTGGSLPTGASTSALQTTGNTSLASIDGKVPALVSGRVPVDPSGVYSPVVGAQIAASASFTRPANTTAYAANGAVSDSTTAATILTFSNSARISGGSGIILSARHVKSSATTTNATFRLYLYRATVSAVNDAAQFALLYANRTSRIGFVDFTHATAGTGSDATESFVTFTNLGFVASATSLFGQLVATAAYVPASAEQHYLELLIAQN